PLVDTSFRAAEDETDFLRLVRQLPEEMSELVFLRYGQEMKLREIAEITGLPVRTVQSKLRYALKKLKKTAAAEQNEERALQNMQDKRGDGDEK
ncbi:MAG: sigma-70 family RNA polymerase sigma factor, partial [Clostridium sp.]